MEAVDLIIVTGSQDNVRRAYRSGTPAIGVGAGNATVIVDETAALSDAAARISASKTFDNATSCSSENVLIVVRSVLDDFLAALHEHGGRLLDETSAWTVKAALFEHGHLNRHMIARDLDTFLQVAGVQVPEQQTARFVVLPGESVGPDAPESGEKLSLALTLYVVDDFAAAISKTREVLNYQGAGHSVGLHSRDDSRAVQLGRTLPTCRVIVNQAHCFATGGSFENGLPFSLSMGCGSWGGNSIDSNLHYRHFMNITRIVRPIPSDEPSLDDVFADYWSAAGYAEHAAEGSA
jgi:sulfoacetaldehyde dehydrogenase